MSEERSTASDVRTLLQAALLVLGSGLTLLAGWAMGGVAGLVGGGLAVIVFFVFLLGLRHGRTKEDLAKGPSTGGVVWYGVYCVMALVVFLANS